jgi:hypothetical protein
MANIVVFNRRKDGSFSSIAVDGQLKRYSPAMHEQDRATKVAIWTISHLKIKHETPYSQVWVRVS